MSESAVPRQQYSNGADFRAAEKGAGLDGIGSYETALIPRTAYDDAVQDMGVIWDMDWNGPGGLSEFPVRHRHEYMGKKESIPDMGAAGEFGRN